MFFSPLALCFSYNHIGGQNTHDIVGMGGPPGMGGFSGIFCFLFVSRIGLIIARLYATLSSLVFRCIHFPASFVSCVWSRCFPTLFIFPAAAATAIYTAGARAFYVVALVFDVSSVFFFFLALCCGTPRPVFFVQPYRRTKYT
jgi:hypothetical protein